MNWPGRAFVIVAFPLLTICAATLYYYLTSRKETESELENEDTTSTLINIPKDVVGKVIGKGGANLRSLEERTSTVITIQNTSIGTPLCTVSGSSFDVDNAVAAIQETISIYSNLKFEEVKVPSICVGKIIGKGGENIRLLSSQTNAIIDVMKDVTSEYKRPIRIKGTDTQIDHAKKMIAKIVRTYEEFSKFSFEEYSTVEEKFDSPGVIPEYEKLIAMPNETAVNVYISSAFGPKTVYLQLANAKSGLLDRLIDNMTEFYSLNENKIKHKLSEVAKGQVVAAQYDNFSDKYYRCIVEEKEGENVNVYYADYGDTQLMNIKNVFSIHPDFLKLKFQAIEAVLDNIISNGQEWSEELQIQFLDILNVGEWKMMSAQVTHYETVEIGTKTKSIPAVKLYDLSSEPAIDVLKELVEKGLGKWRTEKENLLNGKDDAHPKED